jgi:hypothetical protein
MALGYVDAGPQGPVEVWYSADRETLRLQNGRLVGATGLPTEWLRVQLPALPSWRLLATAADGDGYRWERVRDVMPGYRIGERDALILRRIGIPKSHQLQGLDPGTLAWFEEGAASSIGLLQTLGIAKSAETLPPARYAVDLGRGDGFAVYGEQCISAVLCIAWQRWPVQPPAEPRS